MILYKSIFRNKKNYIYIIITSLIFFVLIACNIYSEYYQYLKNDIIGEKKENRTLEVLNVDEEYLQNIQNNVDFEKVYATYPIEGKINQTKIEIKNIIEIQNDSNENDVIINKKLAQEYKLNVGDEIIINVFGISEKLKIVKFTDQQYTKVYVNRLIIEKIKHQHNLKPTSIIFVIKKYENVGKWLELFNQNGYIAYIENSSGEQEIKDLNKLIRISNFFIYVLIAIGIIIVILFFKSIEIESIKYNSLLKKIGFNNYKIIFYNFTKKNIVLIISMIISIIMFYFISLLIFKYFPSLMWFNYKFLNIKSLFLEVIVLFSLNAYISIKYVKKLDSNKNNLINNSF